VIRGHDRQLLRGAADEEPDYDALDEYEDTRAADDGDAARKGE